MSIRPSVELPLAKMRRSSPFSLAGDRLVVSIIYSARRRRGSSICRSREMACSRLSHSSARGWLRRLSLYRLIIVSSEASIKRIR
ncbi:Uncharacterised protein [uncultured Clostridium sp.]|nr:Uncharacterised protein [uncultured Clostridium sp.]